MSDIARVRELIAEAKALGLEGIERVEALPIEQVASEFNGIGPAWFKPELRELLDDAFPLFVPPSLIHDTDYKLGDGSTAQFHEANKRLGRNCRKAADATYKWYDFRRYHYRKAARQFEALCEVFGWKAYKDATAATKEDAHE